VVGTDREQAIRETFEARQLDEAARGALEAYGDEILSFLVSRLPAGSDAREVFSMFAEDMWTGLPGFAWRCSLRTWLYVLARNAASRYMLSPQHKPARHLALSQVDAVSVLVDRLRSATHVYQQTAVKDRVRLLREQLDEEDQTLLILRVDRGMSFRDLAIAMGRDENLDDATIAKEAARLRKAFERIKGQLRELADRAGLLPRDE
jgi:RNA polymerase sigma-70 factor, ECF subfamily